ncbi:MULTISPECIES: DUF1120 domain-containing protein [Pseudomonas fluorescens group]
MKNSFALAAVGALALACTSVQAADLQVTGNISPGSCSLNIPTLAVDYGRVSANDLSPINYTRLGKLSTPFNITCDGPTLVGLSAADNRAASKEHMAMTVIDPWLALPINCFGLGASADGGKIGAFSLHVRNYSVDGSTDFETISQAGNTWFEADDIMRSKPDRILTWSAIGARSPHLLTTVTGEFQIEAAINNTTELVVSDDLQIDGNATLELTYI